MNRISLTISFIGLLALSLLLSIAAPRSASAETSLYTAVPTSTHTLAVPSSKETMQKIARLHKSVAKPRAATPNITEPHLATSLTAKGSDGSSIVKGSTITVPKFPYTVTFTSTITNAGTAPVTVHNSVASFTYDLLANALKTSYQPLPELAPGASATFTKKLVYKTPGDGFLEVFADAYGQINEDVTDAGNYLEFTLLAPHTDVYVNYAYMPLSKGSCMWATALIQAKRLMRFFR